MSYRTSIPFGAAAQKEGTKTDTRPIPVADGWAGADMRVSPLFNLCWRNNGLTDQRTNRPTDGQSVSATKKNKEDCKIGTLLISFVLVNYGRTDTARCRVTSTFWKGNLIHSFVCATRSAHSFCCFPLHYARFSHLLRSWARSLTQLTLLILAWNSWMCVPAVNAISGHDTVRWEQRRLRLEDSF